MKSSVPIELIWIGGLFNFIGGGPRLVYAMFFTMVADAVPATKRYVVLECFKLAESEYVGLLCCSFSMRLNNGAECFLRLLRQRS
jgi:hypothetical protein